MKRRQILLMLVVMACGRIAAVAHHSVTASYDSSRTVSLSGLIARAELINPHVKIELNVKDADGKVTLWAIEMAGPNNLTKRNFDMKLLGVGQQVTVEVWLDKAGAKRANGRTLTTADGTRFNISDNFPTVTFSN